MGYSKSQPSTEFDFYSLLLVILVAAFLITLAIAPLAALVIGIALLVLLVVGEL
ncbi:hypothetical protein [Rossellomorea marisflavi]|jgi:hypothetical protein|uniref:hypothetical protein n=1 Tax=Rossellomorea marisflavi TaxID=189381 RepID=UPI000A611661|nr:hypothetical protein [Rossellomorea marisflavi]VXB50744.1 conserved hypothetical protein [Bacillus sp. 349Y]MCM2591656.1 hypothetical protein [Rossellomorea marisflavi]MDR4937724.1 hypothetical protein [Rossellomorea marisflavi]UTE71613.1 hypothetical protein M1I95_15250 [Rossellomorea marisflavi]GLI84951.1 hypothetical protein ANABIO32_26700 [Rossellomorea marisflavi]